ncbi:MAG: hypothetical protein V2A55_02380 [Candidatus Jorgensenbacteria bacterium]
MKIDDVILKRISDSRGEPTIEVGIKAGGGEFFAQIPSGKSRGSREAAVLPPDEAKKALKNIEEKLVGKDFGNIKEFDGFLIVLDGTPNKAKLGGNLMLGLSLAFARALAGGNGLELWQTLRSEFFPRSAESEPPRIFSNFIEGGVHAESNLDIQEFLVVAESKGKVAETCRKLSGLYESVGQTLKERYGLPNLKLGDENGYSLDFKNNFEPIELLGGEIEKNGLAGEFSLGLDAAASSFYEGGYYVFERKKLTSSELEGVYSDYFRKAPLLRSIEDPFDENDGTGFVKLSSGSGGGKLVIGDDLTVTDLELIKAAAAGKMIGGVIIKPNQIGTVSETCAAMTVAHENGLKCIVSHRSGETEDNFLIHFAKAAGAYGVKIGAPAGERLSKFREFIRLFS